MRIRIQKVDETNLEEILSLHINKNQEGFIESISQCLLDAKESPQYQPVGLYIDKTLVGFAMYGLFSAENMPSQLWLDRFLIDKNYQGKGVGNLMLRSIIDHLYKTYGEQKIYLSLYGDNKAAIHLYEKFGFKFNGDFDVKGEKIMVKDINNNK